MTTTTRLTSKDLLIGLLLLLLIFTAGRDYLLPHPEYTDDGVRVHNGAVKYKTGAYDYDIVISYYDEHLDALHSVIDVAKQELSGSTRVIIYHKGDKKDKKLLAALADACDELVPLDNVGREGETYLAHITRHYHTGSFAGHTLFFQPHLAWEWVLKPRLSTVSHRTGFMSFGPYVNMTNGVDKDQNDFPRINDIYSIFRQELVPPHALLATWAGQFVVSRKRILANSYDAYNNLRQLFHAGPEHWIWAEGWWNSSPSNPTLGHALERSWCVMFDFSDASVAQTCGDGSGSTCQSLD